MILEDLTKRIFVNFHWRLFLVIMAIAFFGVVFLYSASYSIDGPAKLYALKQMVRIMIGLIVFFMIVLIGYKTFLDLASVIYVGTLILLIMVLVFGSQRFGAQRWLSLGPITIQPSEFSKVSLIIFLASFLGSRDNRVAPLKRYLTALIITGVPLLLIMKQPDLGTSLVFIPIVIAILFTWGTKIKYLIFTSLAGLTALPFFWFTLKEYQKNRILSFIDPNKDPLGASYTVVQSKIAIGSGGVVGKGWLKGSQNKLSFIPEHHTDFIFSVVGEEAGFLGVLIFFLLFAYLFYLSFSVIDKTTDKSAKLLGVGITVMVFFHFFVNVGMTIGLMPVTGLPLPLISYGGSSILSFFICFGLLASIYKERSIF